MVRQLDLQTHGRYSDPFTAPEQPLEIRKAALDAVGLICQSSPRNYVSANVYTTFAKVFESQIHTGKHDTQVL